MKGCVVGGGPQGPFPEWLKGGGLEVGWEGDDPGKDNWGI